MAGEIIEQLDHQIELSVSLRKVLLVCLILFDVAIQSL